jgi:peptidoglycan/xylan/chitin deacetylase (PgdA/CDA1 family)
MAALPLRVDHFRSNEIRTDPSPSLPVASDPVATPRAHVPFSERGGRLRGVLDLATGCYPRFLFGGSIGDILPVFHLHDVEPERLDRQLRHLAENGYRTVTGEAIARFVRDRRHPGPNTVVLCFDDAPASLWTVGLPLLRRYGMQAMTFAIPGRTQEATACRPTLDDGDAAARVEAAASPFVTWPELEALSRSGVVDVQSHSYSHSSVFCHSEPVSFVTPAFAARSLLGRPLVSEDGPAVYLSPSDMGAPLFPQRSRLSDARRFNDDAAIRRQCMELVRSKGGEAFFARPTWQRELKAITARGRGRYESDEERLRDIRDELERARSVLNARLRTNTVRYLCFPWGIGGSTAAAAAREVGYEIAFSDRLFGFRAVRAGDDPYRLMRLNGKFITRLPRSRRRMAVLQPGTPAS